MWTTSGSFELKGHKHKIDENFINEKKISEHEYYVKIDQLKRQHHLIISIHFLQDRGWFMVFIDNGIITEYKGEPIDDVKYKFLIFDFNTKQIFISEKINDDISPINDKFIEKIACILTYKDKLDRLIICTYFTIPIYLSYLEKRLAEEKWNYYVIVEDENTKGEIKVEVGPWIVLNKYYLIELIPETKEILLYEKVDVNTNMMVINDSLVFFLLLYQTGLYIYNERKSKINCVDLELELV